MQRTKVHRGHSAAEWALAINGLQKYDEDLWGLRHWNRRESEGWNHNQREEPSFPLLGHGNVFWMFRKAGDVSADSWIITESGAGTQLALQDENGGVAKFINGAADNNFQSYRSRAELLQIPSAGVISFRTRVRILDVSQGDLFVGFCENVTGKDIFDNRLNSVGFYTLDGSGLLYVENGIGGVMTQSGPLVVPGSSPAIPIGQLVDEQWAELAFSIQINPLVPRTAVNFFKNGLHLRTNITNMPTAAMAFYFALRNGQAVANELSITTTVLLNS
jgi:hypothetical protein